MARGPSLANKCQLLFGGAVLLILAGALAAPWIRLESVVEESQREMSRQLAETWVGNGFALNRTEGIPIPIRVVPIEQIEDGSSADPFVDAAYREFIVGPGVVEYFTSVRGSKGIVYRYARALREGEWRAIQDRQFVDFSARASETALGDPLRAILVIERTSTFAADQILSSRWYILAGGVLAVVLAVIVFSLILTKLIFSPVRRLRASAERVRRGDLTVRSALRTGDELEELSRAFDEMLDEMNRGHQSLRAMNESLDLKVVELSEVNVGLFESNRLKSEFLANVSHELRTPLNSIIGFAELLFEIASSDATADPKRVRYISNILTSARMLLDMINELLDMAKIEAGRMSLAVVPSNATDIVEGLQTIMRPQAMARQLTLTAQVESDLPTVETDPGKLQQVLYNFLSNAVKFSRAGGEIRISAESTSMDGREAVRISVSDDGDGVPFDLQETIFEKFRQVDASHTKSHGGTGLGLAICRELATMLGATIGIISQPGHGATFFVEVPLFFRVVERKPLMPVGAHLATPVQPTPLSPSGRAESTSSSFTRGSESQ
ncbi:MAG: HAMP domain-containing histidine kinase [Phycisphaerales bacterium]|nr:HAMP domain-containing histidine kinase [Phycisphaerales bacterium]